MENRIAFARRMRHDPTRAEQLFWTLLSPWRRSGQHWRRQAPIGPFVVDFVCKPLKLVIEIDGDDHHTDQAIAYDGRRTAYLRTRGYRVVRFTNDEVIRERDGVDTELLELLGQPTSFD